MKVKYVGNENGLFVMGKHFTKNVEVELFDAESEALLEKYPTEFECECYTKPVKKEEDSGIADQLMAEELGLSDEELVGDVDGDGDVDIKDVLQVVKNIGKKKSRKSKK